MKVFIRKSFSKDSDKLSAPLQNKLHEIIEAWNEHARNEIIHDCFHTAWITKCTENWIFVIPSEE